ncbi:MAG: mycofactocin-coupled SDR family oxidoreductase [Chloroflexales bacterium]|nr:mycofactocin-coupled SDR family oxidoreductase [Chloroflexales bacterium]
MGKLDGKVAFITGAARGQGRAHATTLAREEANIAALDVCQNLSYPRYSLASRHDLDETVAQVRAYGRDAIGIIADVRDAAAMEAAVQQTVATLGRIDILICNAGVADMAFAWDISEAWWDDMVDINLKGYWLAAKYVVPQMIEQRSGGRIIMTSSVAGLKGMPGLAHYCAAKWGVIGLAKSLALEVAEYGITVNTLHPTAVDTPLITGMIQAAGMPTDEFLQQLRDANLFPVHLIGPEGIANAALWLASDEARYVTGQEFKIDAGMMLK